MIVAADEVGVDVPFTHELPLYLCLVPVDLQFPDAIVRYSFVTAAYASSFDEKLKNNVSPIASTPTKADDTHATRLNDVFNFLSRRCLILFGLDDLILF